MALFSGSRARTAALFALLSLGFAGSSNGATPESPTETASGDPGWLRVGERIRVRTDGRWTEGLLFDWTSDRVTLAGPRGPQAFALSEVTRIDRFVGRRRRKIAGALVGAVVGALADFRESPSCLNYSLGPSDHECTRLESAGFVALGGAALGAAVGALIPHTVWEPATLNPAGAVRSSPSNRPDAGPVAPSTSPSPGVPRGRVGVSIGERVRVTHAGGVHEGVVLASADDFVLATERGSMTIDPSRVTLIEREKVARRSRVGAIAGFVVGSVLTYRSSDICGGGKCDDLVGPLRVGAVTAAIGAAMGYGLPRKIWVPVRPGPERTTPPEGEEGRRRDVALTGLTLQPGREVGFRLRVAW